MTLRTLTRAAEAKQRDEWTRTSWVLAMIRNCNATKRSHCIRPEDVNPFCVRRPRRSGSELAEARRAMGEAIERREKARRQ